MRRTRGKASVVFLLVFSLVVAGSIGIFHWMEGKRGDSTAHNSHEAEHKEGDGRKIASVPQGNEDGHGVDSARENDPEAIRLAEERAREIERGLVAYGTPDDGKTCGSFEYFGRGESHPAPSEAEWTEVMKTYRKLKGGMAKWLVKHRWNMPDATLQALEARMKDVRVQRPPTLEEPDLTWRGIGVLTRDQQGRPLIRLGAGFPKLFKEKPTRARFELARLIAQVWTPCELAASKVETPWSPLLSCLKLDSSAGCGAGQYSEAGWAVSTVVARQVAAPGCELPAFLGTANGAFKACADQIPFPMNARHASNTGRAVASADTSRHASQDANDDASEGSER